MKYDLTDKEKKRIKPCKKCGSNDIKLWECGYSSFSPGGGECRKCGFKVSGEASLEPVSFLINIWNRGQKLDSSEKLKIEQSKTRKLRKQLRDNLIEPVI